MNRRQAFYLAAGSACIVGSLAFGDGATSATIKSEAPQRIAVRPAPRLTAVAVTDPFIALAASSAGAHAPSVPQPNGPVIDAPRSPGIPQPAVVPQAAAGGDQVVLCATWDSAKDGRIPTAVFYVGNDSVVAGAGDDVGGYTLASVERDGVHFKTGESLSIGDCDKLGQSGSDTNSGEANVPQTNAGISPDSMMPQMIPQIMPQTEPTAPSAGPAGPIVPAPASTPFSGSSTIENTYGSTSSGYGTSVYGQAPPTSPPVRIPPQYYRPPHPGVPQ